MVLYLTVCVCVSTLIPIQQQQKVNKFVRFNIYRAIALSSLFGKIRDACIINKQCHVFLFAYKTNHSTVQCVSTIKEIIRCYNLTKSHVWMLDASKASDKVNLLLLFNKLRL